MLHCGQKHADAWLLRLVWGAAAAAAAAGVGAAAAARAGASAGAGRGEAQEEEVGRGEKMLYFCLRLKRLHWPLYL